MGFLNKFKFPALAGILLVVALVSCEEDLTSLGAEVVGGEPFATDKAVYNVSVFNHKIAAVQTNKLPIYQLGVFSDPIYGKTEAKVTSQVQLSTTEFGSYTQANELSGDNSAILENEAIDSVLIYLPYFTNITDSDGDGVSDELERNAPGGTEADVLDATNDTDGDGVANSTETINGTNPLVKDANSTAIANTYAKTYVLDSIYGNREQTFDLKIERSGFFLRDFDPNSNFQDAQEYYSNQQNVQTFKEEVFLDATGLTISDKETLFFYTEDDESTASVVETGTVATRIPPGIRVHLDDIGKDYFQENLLDKEGSSELASAANFKNFFRGIHMSITPSEEELLFLLDLANAKIEVYYHYDRLVDSTTEVINSSFSLSLLSRFTDTSTGITTVSGNAVNTFVNEDYPTEITDAIHSTENASRLYLKGGAGTFAEINLFESDEEINLIKSKNWIVNEARLIFYVDQNVVGVDAIEPPRLNLYNVENSLPIYNISTEVSNTISSSLGDYQNYDGILEEASSRGIKYTVNITEHINDIIIRDSTNATLGLQVTSDIRNFGMSEAVVINKKTKEEEGKKLATSAIMSPLGTVLYGNNLLPEEEEKKLQLEIFYTEIE